MIRDENLVIQKLTFRDNVQYYSDNVFSCHLESGITAEGLSDDQMEDHSVNNLSIRYYLDDPTTLQPEIEQCLSS